MAFMQVSRRVDYALRAMIHLASEEHAGRICTIAEIAAYYVPWLDNALDFLAGPLAVFAGILATAAVTTELPPVLRWSVAIIAGGGTAGAIKTASSIVRLKSTTFTAGFGNFIVSSVELVGAIAASIIAILAPVIAVLAVVGFFFFAYWLTRGIFKRDLKAAR